MKKVYLLSFGILISGFTVTAQVQNAIPAKNSRQGAAFGKKIQSVNSKAEGDIVWSDDFSTPSNWIISHASPHTSGDWAIVNAMPAALTSQVPTYGFPDAMSSASGGNFALVNSDDAGATGIQNTFITATVNLSALGDTALYLEWTEIYRHFHDENYVQISNDGGTTWTEFAVNTESEVPVNTNSGDPEYESINITTAIGAGVWGTNVKIRFRYVGAYDWFWGIDDVQLVQAFNNDIKLLTWQQGTPVQRLDYYSVPVSQTSFPGLTFGAEVTNKGAANQPDVALHVTAPGYDNTGTPEAIPSAGSDSLTLNTPMMLSNTIGDYTVNLSTTMANTDGDMTNNQESFTIRRDAYWYARDDGYIQGAVSQVQSQDGLALSIGNVFEVFDDMDINQVSVRLLQQPSAVGQSIYAEIYYLNSSEDWVFLSNTSDHVIVTADLNNTVTLDLEEVATVGAGQLMLVVAGHYGGQNEVRFGLAQNTSFGTVQGFLQNGSGFSLIDPGAVMIRVSDQQVLSINEQHAEVALNVFPNPAIDEANVAFELTNTANVIVSVLDLTGKVVYKQTMGAMAAGKHNLDINTVAFASGIYTVNFSADNAIVTKKLVVRK